MDPSLLLFTVGSLSLGTVSQEYFVCIFFNRSTPLQSMKLKCVRNAAKPGVLPYRWKKYEMYMQMKGHHGQKYKSLRIQNILDLQYLPVLNTTINKYYNNKSMQL